MGYFKAKEQRGADVARPDADLMCSAIGCPNRWSVDGDKGKACSAHYWSDRRDWPRITQDLQRALSRKAVVL